MTDYIKQVQVTLPRHVGIYLVVNPHYNSYESMYVVNMLARIGINNDVYKFSNGWIRTNGEQIMIVEFYDPEAIMLLKLAFK